MILMIPDHYELDYSSVHGDTEIWIFAYHSYLKNLGLMHTVNLYLSVLSLAIQLMFLGLAVWIFIKCWRAT